MAMEWQTEVSQHFTVKLKENNVLQLLVSHVVLVFLGALRWINYPCLGCYAE